MSLAAFNLAFITCLCLPWIRDPATRKGTATLTGFCLGFFTFGINFLLYIAFVLIGWLQIKLLPARIAPTSMLTVGTTLFLIRMYHNKVSGQAAHGLTDRIQFMFGIIRLCYVACNYKDAVMIAEKKDQLMTPRERLYAEPLKRVPTLTLLL